MKASFNDYIVYVDESGDHGLALSLLDVLDLSAFLQALLYPYPGNGGFITGISSFISSLSRAAGRPLSQDFLLTRVCVQPSPG